MELLVQVNSKEDQTMDYHRVIWCPYIPEEYMDDDTDDPAYLLVVTHGHTVRIILRFTIFN